MESQEDIQLVSVLGRRIRELRLSNNMTQMQLSKRLGYKNNSRVASWENGHNIPSATNVKRLSDIFEVDMVQYVNEGVPTIDINIARIIRKAKQLGKTRMQTIKALDRKGLITEENEKKVIEAVLSGKWVSTIAPKSSTNADAEQSE